MVLMAISGPVLELPRESIEEDWVLVLADRSESMRIEDVQGPEGRISRDRQMRDAFAAQAEMFGMLSEQQFFHFQIKNCMFLRFHLIEWQGPYSFSFASQALSFVCLH